MGRTGRSSAPRSPGRRLHSAARGLFTSITSRTFGRSGSAPSSCSPVSRELGWDRIDLAPRRAEPVPVLELRGLGVQQAALVHGTEGGIGLTDPNFNIIGPVDVSNGVAERLAQ